MYTSGLGLTQSWEEAKRQQEQVQKAKEMEQLLRTTKQAQIPIMQRADVLPGGVSPMMMGIVVSGVVVFLLLNTLSR